MLKQAKGIVRKIHAQRSRIDVVVPDGWKVFYDASLHISDDSGHPNNGGKLWIKQSSTAFSTISFDPASKGVYILFAGDRFADQHEENWVRAEIKLPGTTFEGECIVCGNLRRLFPQNNFSEQTTCDDCLKDLEKKRQETAF